jgi:hypothetical protein
VLHNPEILDMSQTSIIELTPIPASLPLATDAASTEHEHTLAIPRDNGLSKRRSAVVIGSIAGVNFLNTLGSGILTVALPRVAGDLELSRELLLWFVFLTLIEISQGTDLLCVGRRLFTRKCRCMGNEDGNRY